MKRFWKRRKTPVIPEIEIELGARITLTRNGEPVAHLRLNSCGRDFDGAYAIFRDLDHVMERWEDR